MTAEELFRGRLVMAPMARGTDLPFRRLVNEFGCEVAMGEMAFAHKVVKRDKRELALLRRHPSETNFGAQVCGKKAHVLAEAARMAEDFGADFVDLNLGCPVEAATRRGFGAALLQRPGRVADLVSAMKAAVTVPVTIKLRSGWLKDKPVFIKIAVAAEQAGVDAITLHARSRTQRYRQPADWSQVSDLVQAVSVPVIGCGDIMSWQQAEQRRKETGCAAVMVGRQALAKPWIFREFLEKRENPYDSTARVKVLRRYVELCLELHGEDDWGKQRTRRFLSFHQDFFRRYWRQSESDDAAHHDPRACGEPADDLERWLCRGDLAAVEALCDWLIDDGPDHPPALDPTAPRAVTMSSYG